GSLPSHAHGSGHMVGRRPYATARRGNARLSLFVSRDSADDAAWLGMWSLVVAWRARTLDAMVMLDPGELLVPVAGGPVRGPRYARFWTEPAKRVAARAVSGRPRHRLDIRATSTNRSNRPASTVVVNLYARTRMTIALRPEVEPQKPGAPLTINVATSSMRGAV